MNLMRMNLNDFDNNLDLRPYKEIYIFSSSLIEAHSDKNAWFYCDLDEMLDGTHELNFYLINHMKNKCRCLSCPPVSDLAFTVYLNKVTSQRIPYIINCYKQLVNDYFIPKKSSSSIDSSFEDFRYEYLIISEDLL